MAITEQIQANVQKLPPPLQAEVLDFVEYLVAKAERLEADNWSELSLALALRGMEDEGLPGYTMADLKEVFA